MTPKQARKKAIMASNAAGAVDNLQGRILPIGTKIPKHDFKKIQREANRRRKKAEDKLLQAVA